MQNSFLLREIFCLYCTVVFALFVFFPFVFVLSTALLSCFSIFRKFAEPGTEGDRSNRGVSDDLLYQLRSTDHLDFSPIKGIFCIQYLFVRLYFSLIAFEMIGLSLK